MNRLVLIISPLCLLASVLATNTYSNWTTCEKCFQFRCNLKSTAVLVRRCGPEDCKSVTTNPNISQSDYSVKYNEKNCGLLHLGRKKNKITMKLRSERRCQDGECPWLVRIEIHVSSNIIALCAGAIVHPQWIATAAHCLVGSYISYNITFADPNIVRITHEGMNWNKSVAAQSIKVEKYIVNPRFQLLKEEIPVNDIVLIKLAKPLAFDEYTNAICLPSPGMLPPVGSLCMVAGWGRSDQSSMVPSTFPRKSMHTVVSSEDCVLTPFLTEPLPPSKICVNNDGGNSICEGDSGTPLACEGTRRIVNEDNSTDKSNTNKDSKQYRWFMFGIASYGGSACDATNKQNIFASVSFEISWILSTIAEH